MFLARRTPWPTSGAPIWFGCSHSPASGRPAVEYPYAGARSSHLYPVTGYPMSGAGLAPLGHLLAAQVDGQGTASIERAPRRWVRRAGRIAGQNDALPTILHVR